VDVIALGLLSFLQGTLAGIALGVMIFLLQMGMHVPQSNYPSCTTWILGLINSVFYFASFEWLYGATPGKLLLGMRVVGEDGQPCTLKATVVRDLWRLLDSLFFGLVANRAMATSFHQQRYGDQRAHTYVVDRHDPFIQRRRPWPNFLAALVLFAVLGTAVSAASMLVAGKPRPLIKGPAAELNLRASDLPTGWVKRGELTRDQLGVQAVLDANLRTFVGKGALVWSTVYLDRTYVTQVKKLTLPNLMLGLRKDFGGEAIEFGDPQDVSLGEEGVLLRFSVRAQGGSGWAVLFGRQNALVQVLLYGSANATMKDEALRLARIVDGRVAAGR